MDDPASPTVFLKPKPNLPKILLILIALLAIVVIAGFVYFKHPFNLFQPKKIVTTPIPTLNERFISIPGKTDNILGSLPKKIEPGVIYFYKNTENGGKGETASYLESKIVSINKKQKSLSLEATNSATPILITIKDYSAIQSITFNTTSKPSHKDISFNDLEIGDNIFVSSLKYNVQGYIAGTIVKKK